MATEATFDRKAVAAELNDVLTHLENVMSHWKNHEPGKDKPIDRLWNAKELINDVMMELDPEQENRI